MGNQKQKSALVPIGCGLILLGILAPNILSQLANGMRGNSQQLSPTVRILYFATDALRVCFFIGIACAIIGYLRNRKK